MNANYSIVMLFTLAMVALTKSACADTIVKRDINRDVSEARTLAIYRVKSATCLEFSNGPGCRSIQYSLQLISELKGEAKEAYSLRYKPAVAEVLPVGTSALFYELVDSAERGSSEVYRGLQPIVRLNVNGVTREVVMLDSLTASKGASRLLLSVASGDSRAEGMAFISEDSGRGARHYVPLEEIKGIVGK